MSPQAIKKSQKNESIFVAQIPGDLLLRSKTPRAVIDRFSALSNKPEWKKPEFRQAYAEAAVEQGVAWQIRANREARGLSQTQLGEKIGTHQSAISRLEDPEHGGHTLPTLLKLAHAFDCALSVKFIPYSQLAWDANHLTPAHLYAAPYSEETTNDQQ